MPAPIKIERETINQLYHIDNLKMSEVAQKLGVCRDTIRGNMRLYGIPPKTPKVYRKGQHTRIVAMLPQAKELYYGKEYSFGETCQKLRISFYSLKRLFNENNLQLRHPSETVKLAYQKHPQMGFKSGNMHPRYNGYRTNITRSGYVRVYIPGHPRGGVNGYVCEHILVWEDNHKMPLPKGWTVHHLNGIKDDNRPENLLGLPDRLHRRILAEKAKRISKLEDRVRELEQSLLEATKMNLP